MEWKTDQYKTPRTNCDLRGEWIMLSLKEYSVAY
jgi:hypothetical protein